MEAALICHFKITNEETEQPHPRGAIWVSQLEDDMTSPQNNMIYRRVSVVVFVFVPQNKTVHKNTLTSLYKNQTDRSRLKNIFIDV